MKCKACKNEVPDGSIFCNMCGERLVRAKAQKKKEVSVPKPRQQKSGEWIGQVMVNGERHTVKASSVEEYRAKAQALKAGLIKADKPGGGRCSLRDAIRKYIDTSSNVLSPATIRGYEIIYRNRFKDYMDREISSINFQQMVNDEAATVSPKTVCNAWGLVAPAITAAGLPAPQIKKPQVPASDEDWLDYEQIKVFLDTVKGRPVEPAALLALHGLRLSELLDLDVSQISAAGIAIRGATVMDKENHLVHKSTNKNKTSRRDVPVLIPRLLDVLPSSGKAVHQHPSSIRRGIEKACVDAGLPVCSVHDLRRSFASLAYHLKWNSQTTMIVGGWSNLQTVEKVYRKLATQDKNADIEKMLLYFNS